MEGNGIKKLALRGMNFQQSTLYQDINDIKMLFEDYEKLNEVIIFY